MEFVINWDAVSCVSFIVLTILIIWFNHKQHERMIKLEQMNLKVQTFNKYFDIYSVYKRADYLLSLFDLYINDPLEIIADKKEYLHDLKESYRQIQAIESQIDILFDEKICNELKEYKKLIISHILIYRRILTIVKDSITFNQSQDIFTELKKAEDSFVFFKQGDVLPSCRVHYNEIEQLNILDILKSKCELYKN